MKKEIDKKTKAKIVEYSIEEEGSVFFKDKPFFWVGRKTIGKHSEEQVTIRAPIIDI